VVVTNNALLVPDRRSDDKYIDRGEEPTPPPMESRMPFNLQRRVQIPGLAYDTAETQVLGT